MNIKPLAPARLTSGLSPRILRGSAVALLALASAAHGQFISITGSTIYTQNFDSLGILNQPWTDNVTLPGCMPV